MYAEKGVKLDEARELVLRALEMEPENGAFIDSLGWIYFQQGEIDKAIDHLEAATELLPDDPTIHDHLGAAYARRGESARAIEQWKKALSLGPPNAEAIREKIETLQSKTLDLN